MVIIRSVSRTVSTVDIQADKVVVKGKLGELEQDYAGVTFEDQTTPSLLKEIQNLKIIKLDTVCIVPCR